jgi:hypothetical protein
VSQSSEAGKLTADEGSYTMASTTGRITSGTYQILNSGSFATQSPAGTAMWHKR